MIKRYYNIIKSFFKMGAYDKLLLFKLFMASNIKSFALLLIPFVAAEIVECITLNNYSGGYFYSILFLIIALIYIFMHHYTYDVSTRNALLTHEKLQRLIINKMSYYDDSFTKDISNSYIITASFNDVGVLMHFPEEIFNLLSNFLSIFIIIVILFNLNILLGICTILLLVGSIFFLSFNMTKRDHYLSYQRKYQGDISHLMEQIIEGNTEIRSFDLEDNLDKIMNRFKKNWKVNFFYTRKYNNNMFATTPFILGIGKIFIYFILSYFILNGLYDVAVLVLVIGYYENIQNLFGESIVRLDNVSGDSVRIDRLNKIINYRNDRIMIFGNNNNTNIDGNIDFLGVNYSYEGKKIIKNLNLSIKSNTMTAIVGKSGSGKSTILKLLLRLSMIDKGEILLDNASIYDYTKKVYSTNVSIVTEEPFIFDMSIKENLSLVDSNHDNQVLACKRVGIHDYIMSLKDGYNTKMFKNASNISNGERQLIALARTLLSGSEVLLFDEVTAGLDLMTTNKIIEVLNDLKKDHTVIVVTHKPNIMCLADSIVVLDNGSVVGNGTHRELIRDNIYYQRLQK